MISQDQINFILNMLSPYDQDKYLLNIAKGMNVKAQELLLGDKWYHEQKKLLKDKQ